MLKSTCKFLFDWRWVSILTSFFRRRYSANGTVVRKISVINKSLFHLIDDIFWNLGFKNETQADKVIVIICIIPLISIIHLLLLHVLYLLYQLYVYINYFAGSYRSRNRRSRRRYSDKWTVVKKISLINKGLFHLIDDIFWNLGFKNETQAGKV